MSLSLTTHATHHKLAFDEARQEAQHSVLYAVGYGAKLHCGYLSDQHSVRLSPLPRVVQELYAQYDCLFAVAVQQLRYSAHL